MKITYLLLLFMVAGIPVLNSQSLRATTKQEKEISSLIDKYSQARESRDTFLLKTILTANVDQQFHQANGEMA